MGPLTEPENTLWKRCNGSWIIASLSAQILGDDTYPEAHRAILGMTPEGLMSRSMDLAEHCRPTNKVRTPRLGVVLALHGVIIGEASRGAGEQGDDDHAEVIAIESVANKSRIPGSTVYTTLEPCTHHMGKATSESCTDLLIRSNVARVVVGILGPNQGICGGAVN